MNSPYSILIVDDEAENLKALERTLRADFDVVSAETPAKALELLKEKSFAAIISDQRMPDMTGTDLLHRAAQIQPLATRIVLTAFTDSKEIMEAINRAEIYRYFTKPWDNQELIVTVKQAVERYELLKRNEGLVSELTQKNTQLVELNRSLETLVEQRTAELRAANEKLSEQAMTDPLTKIFNRRAFFLKFNEELDRSKRYRHPISIAMIDVDHFKTFNDMEGHLFGDEALRKLTQLFQSNLRKTDVLSRYGGEEFLVMMPETKVTVGSEICERLRAAVEASEFQGQLKTAYLTVSIGVAGFPGHGETPQDLVQAADQALYEAKEFGRNRVVRK